MDDSQTNTKVILVNDRASDYTPLCDAVSYTPSLWAMAQGENAPYLRNLTPEEKSRVLSQRNKPQQLHA